MLFVYNVFINCFYFSTFSWRVIKEDEIIYPIYVYISSKWHWLKWNTKLVTHFSSLWSLVSQIINSIMKLVILQHSFYSVVHGLGLVTTEMSSLYIFPNLPQFFIYLLQLFTNLFLQFFWTLFLIKENVIPLHNKIINFFYNLL